MSKEEEAAMYSGPGGAGSGIPGSVGVWDNNLINRMTIVNLPISSRPSGSSDSLPVIHTSVAGGIGGPGTAGGGPDCGPVPRWPPASGPIIWDHHLLDTVTSASHSRTFEGLDIVPRESEAANMNLQHS